MSRSLHKAEELAQAGETQFDSQVIEEELRERYAWAKNQPPLVCSFSDAETRILPLQGLNTL